MISKIYDKVIKFIKENIWFIISLIAIILIFNIELPYSVETPGGFISLEDRIKIDGKDNYKNNFGLTYVSVIKGNIPFILLSYINPNWDVVKKDNLKYDSETLSDMEKRNKIYLNEAIGNAIISAYSLSNNYINITKTKMLIGLNDNLDNNLKVGDEILEVDNQDLKTLKEVQDYLKNYNKDEIVVKVLRDDKTLEINSKLKDYNGVKKLGISIINNYEYQTNPNIKINSKNNESGPSGGFMMALAIYDELTESNLTNGRKVAGTGTISVDGKVGEIGGVKYKLIGAKNKGVDIFLCPKENYEEAKKIIDEKKYDMKLVSVETLSDAINYLKG